MVHNTHHPSIHHPEPELPPRREVAGPSEEPPVVGLRDGVPPLQGGQGREGAQAAGQTRQVPPAAAHPGLDGPEQSILNLDTTAPMGQEILDLPGQAPPRLPDPLPGGPGSGLKGPDQSAWTVLQATTTTIDSSVEGPAQT